MRGQAFAILTRSPLTSRYQLTNGSFDLQLACQQMCLVLVNDGMAQCMGRACTQTLTHPFLLDAASQRITSSMMPQTGLRGAG
jgi:hypothetical protein